MAEGNGHREPATPQEIWAILREVSAMQQETARRMQDTDRQTARRMQEADRRQQEADRQMQETDRRLQETDQLLTRQTRAADRRMDKLEELFNGQWGKLMESLVEGDLVALLQQRGIAVQHTVTNPRQNYGERRWEFDLVAINGEQVVVVEVKTSLRVPDVDRFIGRRNLSHVPRGTVRTGPDGNRPVGEPHTRRVGTGDGKGNRDGPHHRQDGDRAGVWRDIDLSLPE